MKVGIIQSNYIPWRGYFDFIASVDLFLFHDDLQYTKGDWRNRNKIKTKNGLKWITVPVNYAHTNQLICDTTIDYHQKWWRDHLNQFRENYFIAPCYGDICEILEKSLPRNIQTISELNISLIKNICGYLKINTPMLMTSEFEPEGSKSERLVSILRKAGASTYVSGPAADGYLEKELFKKSGICIEYKSYDYPEYPQLHGAFEPRVTVLDVIANCGEKASQLSKSLTPNKLVA
ncbi:MAG: WbqC family protein [Sulfuricella sp.]|nr:WbqC family protein [Sulfuricella sp.]